MITAGFSNIIYEYKKSDEKLTSKADAGTGSCNEYNATRAAATSVSVDATSSSRGAPGAASLAEKGNDPVRDWTSDTEVRKY